MHSQKNKFPLKKDFKIKCNLETKMKKPVEPRKKVRNMTALDTNMIFTKAPFIQYQQFKLKRNFKQYIEIVMISAKTLRIEIQKIPLQKTYDISFGLQSFSTNFLRLNKQFNWLKIPLVSY